MSSNRGPDDDHLHHLAGVPFRPVFITGPHRSGTTFLYLLLQATGRFNVVTTYHVLRYRELLTHHFTKTTPSAREELAAEFRAAGLPDRGIDGVPLTPEMPEEYGFILAARGPRPQRRNPRVTSANLPLFTEICRKVQFTGHPDRPLLLKNPWDADNFLFLKQNFPGARFLFLHRDPARTLNSLLRALRFLLAARNPYLAMLSPEYDRLFHRPLDLGLARVLYGGWHGFAPRLFAGICAGPLERYLRQRNELPTGSAFGVRYEELCQSPNETIAAILGWLDLDRADLPDFRQMVSPRGGGLLPEVERARPWLTRRLQAYCDEFGYRREGDRLP